MKLTRLTAALARSNLPEPRQTLLDFGTETVWVAQYLLTAGKFVVDYGVRARWTGLPELLLAVEYAGQLDAAEEVKVAHVRAPNGELFAIVVDSKGQAIGCFGGSDWRDG